MYRLQLSPRLVLTCLLLAVAFVACNDEPVFEWEGACSQGFCYKYTDRIPLLAGYYTMEIQVENLEGFVYVEISDHDQERDFDYSQRISLFKGEGTVKKSVRITATDGGDYQLAFDGRGGERWRIAIYEAN